MTNVSSCGFMYLLSMIYYIRSTLVFNIIKTNALELHIIFQGPPPQKKCSKSSTECEPFNNQGAFILKKKKLGKYFYDCTIMNTCYCWLFESKN